ncbi:MAG: formate/nitrite transporter family protein [Planctomycetota bacterium]
MTPDSTANDNTENIDETGDGQNERSAERRSEDENFTHVIVKRTDEHLRHPDDALQIAIREGLHQMRRPTAALLLSSTAAGLVVGFSAAAVAVVHATLHEAGVHPGVIRLAAAFAYPLGFMLCILSGAQLFTEHTATALYPVLDRAASIASLIRLWLLVVAGNLIGTLLGSLLLSTVFEVLHAEHGITELGKHLIEYSSFELFFSALHAGWLMALGGWLICICPRPQAQMMAIFVVTFLIGLCGFHHSIAGSTELFTAMLSDGELRKLGHLTFVPVALFGNLVGGSIFVATLNYACVRELERDA